MDYLEAVKIIEIEEREKEEGYPLILRRSNYSEEIALDYVLHISQTAT